MKILIVANYTPNEGGISGVVFNHYRKLSDEGNNMEIFNTKRNPLIRLYLIFKLINKVKKNDIIHIHGCSGLGFYPIFVGVLSSKIFTSKKTIVTYHGGGAEAFLNKRERLIKWFLNNADHVTVMSKYLHEVFRKYNIHTIILKNVIDIENENENRSDFSFPKIISVRSLSKIYNVNDIIEAFKKVKEKYKNASLKIAGSGEQLKSIKKLGTDCADIEFLGVLPNNKIPLLLKSNNIFVSVPSFDNQPMSILEAFSSGIIVISTSVGGVADMIEDGRTGLLVDVNNPQQIAEKIDWIISNPQLSKRIIVEAKREVEKYFWENIRPVLVELYEN